MKWPQTASKEVERNPRLVTYYVDSKNTKILEYDPKQGEKKKNKK